MGYDAILQLIAHAADHFEEKTCLVDVCIWMVNMDRTRLIRSSLELNLAS